MSFLNLPTDWSETPLSDPTLAADVVDLCLSVGDRRLGLLKAIFCDSEDRFHGQVEIELRDRRDQLHLTDPRAVLEPLAVALRSAPSNSVLLALGRPGPSSWPAIDNNWAETASTICADSDIPLLAFYVATPEEVHRVEATVNA
jgi:hypothetical protein